MNLDNLLDDKFTYTLTSPVKNKIKGKTFLITGAAGSIGSKISKVLAKENSCKLILLDIDESGLFELQQDLFLENCSNFELIIANICDEANMKLLFNKFSPNIIYHTAAYKHVPLMESNAYQAIKVNVLGTKIIADLAKENKANQFIFLSTDKAVYPKSVMGATKRISELYTGSLNNNSDTKFKIVRFGNIPYSQGSVLPLFKKQIEKKKMITITNSIVSRYFISMNEACCLLFEALLENDSNLMVYEMGNIVGIKEIAQKIIEKEGYKPGQVQIKEIGLRPGEKIMEELTYENEQLIGSNNSKLKKYNLVLNDTINNIIEKISEITITCSNDEIKNTVKKLLPEYK